MRLHKLIASGLGTGFSPVAPGTAGAALGIVVFYLINLGFIRLKITEPFILVLNLFAILIILFIGIYSIKKVHREWTHDAQTIVIDEIAGVWVAAYALPFQWQYYLYAFILFRLFDIYKPLFIKKIDNMKNDWSVMFDDVLAGIYAAIVLQIIIYVNIL